MRLCRECPDAKPFQTGSSIFWLCQKNAEPKMRGYADTCIFDERKNMLSKNPRGYVHAVDEKELYCLLENGYLEKIFGKWTPQIQFAPYCFIDYMVKKPKLILIEVKNWFVKIKDMQQIMKYLVHATERFGTDGFRFVLICGGIERERRGLLEGLGVEIILTKDIFKEPLNK